MVILRSEAFAEERSVCHPEERSDEGPSIQNVWRVGLQESSARSLAHARDDIPSKNATMILATSSIPAPVISSARSAGV